MKEITELDMTKYLVLRQEDIDAELSPGQKIVLKSITRVIKERRMKRGKPYPSGYLVLSLDDKIDISLLTTLLLGKHPEIGMDMRLFVNDIAVDLVNAILKARGDKNE